MIAILLGILAFLLVLGAVFRLSARGAWSHGRRPGDRRAPSRAEDAASAVGYGLLGSYDGDLGDGGCDSGAGDGGRGCD